ncbi:MAG: Na+/H+ antiporter subunit E, partial [Chromatiales bacterium]|nr:Na+/H+ antiporter subunit E [Chromatiales bacterium]
MSTTKGFLYQWLTLFVIWVIANSSLDPQILSSGAVLSLIVTLLFTRFSGAYREISISPRTIYYYLLYVGVFLVELVKANLNVARLVFSPKVDIHPGIVEIKTKLKSRTGRLVLANSITLTPG